MYKVIFVSLFLLLSTACVRFEIKPGSVVADTVDAGKSLYSTIKRKRNGEEEREYSHSLISPSEEVDTENTQRCKEQIKKNIEASSATLSKTLSESSDVNIVGELRKLTCTMVVLVKPI